MKKILYLLMLCLCSSLFAEVTWHTKEDCAELQSYMKSNCIVTAYATCDTEREVEDICNKYIEFYFQGYATLDYTNTKRTSYEVLFIDEPGYGQYILVAYYEYGTCVVKYYVIR